MSQGRRLRNHSPYTPPSVSDRDRDPHVAVRRSLPLHVSWRGASAAWSPADSSGCTSTARGACRSIGTGCSGGGLCGSGWSRRSACGSAAAEAVSAPGCSGCSGSRMSAAWLMSFLKQVLVEKARVRPNKFFGEAFVASHVSHDEGYYCSFKWLTSATWTDGSRSPSASAAEFKQALRIHFPRLAELQARARTISERLGGPTPVAPDLWLLANGEHRFIEVKLSGDYLRSPQYAGLALLAAHLPSALPIAVSVVTLDSSEDQFKRFTQILRR